MSEIQNSKIYDLEERCQHFAGEVRLFVKILPRTIGNVEDGKQLIRSSGSIGANYIEANESLSKKDLIMRIKISRKEAKETRYWLGLVDTNGESSIEEKRRLLFDEANQLMMILGSILHKVE